ncbi:glycogen/starch/alpha-glucan phosphorylase [Anaerococcus sp. AGMB00486]|uniref:Alpha-1,4 glucan phosphorylase n=2 Tax=Anaerococcus TaxID=165779 RepID=A0ABX2N7Y2_9FIRM|nr:MULTISPECIES: glycogen/starch/alpha-glucan phosphorylase [Anaerococcus]MSS76837.1 glycogen/starch/alpha-glucan phosphorylase [Anaerococcus porci]NVF10679.1 glycogen/starch/alpha-glucan phosphorylase [Anaerococcus faecalis]
MKDNIILKRIQSFLYSFYAKDLKEARIGEVYDALVNALMQDLGIRWVESNKINNDIDTYLLSFEYNPSKFLEEVVLSLDLKDQLDDFIKDIDFSYEDLINYEKEPSLGNGDIGTAAWYLIKEFSKKKIKAMAYALRYESGSMKQEIREGKQFVNPNNWLYRGNKWEHKKSFSYILNIENRDLKSVAYDMPVINRNNKFINTLRLWKSESINKINYMNLSSGDLESVYSDYAKDNSLTQFLYLDNSNYEGKFYRLRQEYFYCVSCIQDIFRRYFKKEADIKFIGEKVNIILADIHPTQAIIEFIRSLYQGYGIELEESVNLARKVFTHIAILLTPESKEYYSMDMVKKIDSNFYEFLYILNEYCKNKYNDSIFENNSLSYKKINMYFTKNFYYLSKVYQENSEDSSKNSSYINFGIDKELYSYTNNEYFNKVLSNHNIYNIESFALDDFEDKTIFDDLDESKLLNKKNLIKKLGLENDRINPYSIFDMQLSVFHEAKRQLLNALSIASIYYKLKDNSNINFSPTSYIFSGFANDGYFMAKEVIKFILALKHMIDSDVLIKNKLKIIFIEDINVEKSKILYPACDIYSNLTLVNFDNESFNMLNSAHNFSNICSTKGGILENITKENSIYKFGNEFIEINDVKKNYNARDFYYKDDIIRYIVDNLINEDYYRLPYNFKIIYDYLIKYNDSFFIFKDLDKLTKLRFKMSKDYLDKELWINNEIRNIIWANNFSLDKKF